jgi:NADH dehydrogenase
VLWAAGVNASDFTAVVAQATGAQTDRGGRILVDDHCRVPGHPEIFIIGDIASLTGPDGTPVPGVAPAAMQQGRYVARVIEGREQRPFRYRDKGNLAVIGRASAVAQFPKLKAHGFVAWLLWLFIHLMYLVGFQNRLIVFIRWAFNYFTYNRGARLITGEEPHALS